MRNSNLAYANSASAIDFGESSSKQGNRANFANLGVSIVVRIVNTNKYCSIMTHEQKSVEHCSEPAGKLSKRPHSSKTNTQISIEFWAR